MKALQTQRDAELLADRERPGDSFTVFYRRHVDDIIRFFARRGANAAQAADLTAETFSSALLARAEFQPERGEARGWLFGIAANKLADSRRRWVREDRARRRLGLEQPRLHAQDVEDFEILRGSYDGELQAALQRLPPGQRDAVHARVVDELSYDDVGLRLGVDAVTARQRVSRGLAGLREKTKEQNS